MNDYSFKKGFLQVRQKDVQEVKQRIMSALGVTTRTGWCLRLNGAVEPKVSEAKAVEEIFAEYGIMDVWGSES